MNNLYNSLMPNNNIMSQFQTFQKNSMQFLMSKNINIPQQYMSNPREAIQYLLNSGKMTQENFNQLSQMASQMGLRLH